MKLLRCMILSIFLLCACSAQTPAIPTLDSSPEPDSTSTPFPTLEIPLPTFTSEPESSDRPVFLAWPLPSYIGLARISQYPNSPWTWNYLGLNEGHQCPPMFGYLLNVDSWIYWRDNSIPEAQDKAQADPHNFEMVECYFTDGNAGANGHEGTDIKAPAGTPVFAAADGRVQEWRLTGLNNMIVLKHCLGGEWNDASECVGGTQWYTTYMHIIPEKDLLTENLAVLKGTHVGVIYDQTINSHLHLEVGLDKRSYTNFVNPWGRDAAPWLGCLWLDQSLCVNPDPSYERMAFYSSSGELTIQQGQAKIATRDVPNIAQLHLYGDRIVLLDTDGNVSIHDGDFRTGEAAFRMWAMVSNYTADVQVTNHRIAILTMDGMLHVKEDNADNVWQVNVDHVQAFSMSDHRVGYLNANGELFVNEGNLSSAWIPLASGVDAFQLTDNRIAILDSQSTLYLNEGELSSEWQPMAEQVKTFQVTNLRVGILDVNGNLLVKEGNLRAEWLNVAENVTTFQLSNYRLLLRTADGIFKYQSGNLYESLMALPAGLQNVTLNDGVPVIFP